MTNQNCFHMNLDFMNVGYGDAVLIRTCGEQPRRVLVDCGDVRDRVRPGRGERRTASDYLDLQGIRSLDVFWLTHLHLDHAGGLLELVKNVRIHELVTGYLPPAELLGREAPVPEGAGDGVVCLLAALNIYSRALETLSKGGTRLTLVGPGEAACGIDWPELRLTPYFTRDRELFAFQKRCFDGALLGRPDAEALGRLDLAINDLSVGLRAESGPASAELPGDLGLDICKALLRQSCSVFKVPHHGHRAAVDPELMEVLKPELTVISVSDDRTDGCPNGESVAAARAFSGRIAFTDAVEWDGKRELHPSVLWP